MQHVYVILLKGSGSTSTWTIVRGRSRLKIVFSIFHLSFLKQQKIYFFNIYIWANCTFPPLTIGSSQFPPLSIKSSNVPLYVLKICKSPPTV